MRNGAVILKCLP